MMWYITRNRVEYWSIKKDNANNAISCYEKDNVIISAEVERWVWVGGLELGRALIFNIFSFFVW